MQTVNILLALLEFFDKRSERKARQHEQKRADEQNQKSAVVINIYIDSDKH